MSKKTKNKIKNYLENEIDDYFRAVNALLGINDIIEALDDLNDIIEALESIEDSEILNYIYLEDEIKSLLENEEMEEDEEPRN